jgi:monovalent cation/hydrogen antiporter
MAVFELVIALLFVGAALSSVARRANVPYPALLALAGAGLALLPNVPSVSLDPELALTLFVAPVLLDAAFDSSPRDLKQNWGPVTGLALCAVVLTVAVVAWIAHALVPAMPWSAAVALGAIVAPPDAAAATAVLKQMRLPHRLLVILEGESLFNDASALLIYRIAVASAIADTFSAWQTVPMLLLGSVGSVPLGLVLARLSTYTLGRIQDVAIAVIVQFVSTFAVWMLAERLHLSGIITVVVFAIAVARTAPDRTPARLRVPSYAVWEVAVFVLNVLAFMLVGLQLKPILERLTGPQLARYVLVAGAVCLAVVLVRIAWVISWELLVRWARRRAREAASAATSKRAAVVVAWSGMRGIVTLATALALPVGSEVAPAFPERDLILFTAFSVVLVTLVFQGMSLSPLIRLLSLEADGSIEREIDLARRQTIQAALQALSESDDTVDGTALLRRKYEARLQQAETSSGASESNAGESSLRAAQIRALSAERRTLSDLRAQGVIGDDAFHRIEEELDWAELHANALRH